MSMKCLKFQSSGRPSRLATGLRCTTGSNSLWNHILWFFGLLLSSLFLFALTYSLSQNSQLFYNSSKFEIKTLLFCDNFKGLVYFNDYTQPIFFCFLVDLFEDRRLHWLLCHKTFSKISIIDKTGQSEQGL